MPKLSSYKKFIFVFIVILICNIFYFFIFPDVSRLNKENPSKTSLMKYREEQWKQNGKKIKIRQKWVLLSRISPYLIRAVIVAEDDKFWHHEGFDFDAIEKALQKNIKAGKFKVGGSTISQQLTKNIYLNPEKNILRKIKEAIITWRLEKKLSKKRILELYLNVAEWGEGIYGVEAASNYYYNKSAFELTPEEAIRLAVVLPNPLKYKPTNDSLYVKKRAEIIYKILIKRGIIIPEYKNVIEDYNGETYEDIK
jgi:monofunctional biosynthetic peptidoglycan transglycosylase